MSRPLDWQGWMPIRVVWRDGEPHLDWCYFGAAKFADPFFNQTVEMHLQRPAALLFRRETPLAIAEELPPALAPNGFIFHLSRCGSTLVSQMLAALPDSLVVSEPPPLDSILQANSRLPNLTTDEHITWLRWMVKALGRRRNSERYFFIKFDAWSVLSLPLIRQAFPTVPWIFIYRDPVEVLVSQERTRSAHMMPGLLHPKLVGMDLAEAFAISLDEYAARMLASICRAALAGFREGGGKLINHTQLPDVVTAAVFPFFGIPAADTDAEIMAQVASRHAKHPSIAFADDSRSKRDAASPHIREVANKWTYPFFEELERARLG